MGKNHLSTYDVYHLIHLISFNMMFGVPLVFDRFSCLYFIVLVDDYTQVKWVYPINDCMQALDISSCYFFALNICTFGASMNFDAFNDFIKVLGGLLT